MKSCNIFARKRNRETGLLTTTSKLHKKLLTFGKESNNPQFNRKRANRALFLSLSPKFLEMHREELIFDSNELDSEPLLVSLWETMRNGEMKDISLKDMKEYLSKQYGEGIYSYELGYLKVLDFNKSKAGGNTFIGTIKITEDGKYKFSVELNTVEEQQKLINTISKMNLKQTIDSRLLLMGVGVVEDKKSYYNTIDPEKLEGGLLGVIHVKKGIRYIKDLCYETGHFLVGALGRENTLVLRLRNVVIKNPDVVISILGEGEYNLYANNDLKIDEYIGHIVGKTLENWDTIENKGVLGTIKSFITRMLDYLHSRLAFSNREFEIAQYAAKYAAYDIVKSMMQNNFKGSLKEALSNTLRLEGNANPILDSLTETIKQVNIAFNTLRDSSKSVFKNYKTVVAKSMEELIKLTNNSLGIFNYEDLQKDSIKEFLKIALFLLNEASVASDLLAQAYRGVKNEGNEEFTLQELALIVKYNETVLKCISSFTSLRRQICDNIIEIGNPADTLALRNDLINVFNLLEKITTGQTILNRTNINDVDPFLNYSTAIYEVRRKMALNLLIEVNGSLFIAIDLYVHFDGRRIAREYNPDLIDLKEELMRTSINPSFAYINRWIDGLAESPDIVNQLVHLIVENQKYKANKETLDLKNKLNHLYRELREIGLKDTDIFFERDENGKYTGNLISERNWGAWEAAYKQRKKDFDDEWFEKKKSSLTGDVKKHYSRNAMYNDYSYISAWEGVRKEWMNKNSSSIIQLDDKGQPIIDPITGKPERLYVPALSGDENSIGKNYYASPQYLKLLQENPKAILWLDKYLTLKKELDSILPVGGTNRYGVRAPLFTTHLAGRLKNAISTSTGTLEGATSMMGITLRNFCSYALSESPNDTEYGTDEDTYDIDEVKLADEIVFNRAHSNALASIRRVPVYGVKKLRNMEEISTDLIRSTLAYGAMAYSYKELNSIAELVELLPKLFNDKDFGRKVDSDIPIGSIPNKTSYPDSYCRLEDYINMLVFNIYTDLNHKWDNRVVRKVLNKVTRFGSVYFLGFNVHSAFVNAFTGLKAIMKESWTNEEVTFKKFIKAEALYLNYWTRSFGENFCNIFVKDGSMIESSNKMDLFFRQFDVGDNANREFKNYHIMTKGYGFARGYLFSNIALMPYSITDDWMLGITFLMGALCTNLHNKTTGETTSIWDAYKIIKDTETGENILVLKDNPEDWEIKDLNLEKVLKSLLNKVNGGKILSNDEIQTLYVSENGVLTTKLKSTFIPWDDKEQAKFKVRIRSINNRMHGVYNSSDGGAFMKSALATPILSLKKYAIGLFDAEFSRARYDLRTKQMRQGTTTTALILLLDLAIYTNQKSGETGIMKTLEEGNPTFTLSGKKYESKALGNAWRFIFGILKLMFFATTGGIVGKSYLRRRGYSNNLIANINRFWSRWVMAEIFKTIMYLCAPPDEDEDETLITSTINKGLELLSLPNIRELTEGEIGEGISEVLTKGHVGLLKMLSSVLPITVDDDYYLDESTLEYAVSKEHDSIPFSIKGILYYHAYRALMEEQAYNALDLFDSRYAAFSEMKSVVLNIAPTSASALFDVFNLATEMFISKTEEELEDVKDASQYAEIEYDKYKKVYQRSENEGYVLSTYRFLKTAFNPFRTAFVYLDGYESKENYDWFKQIASKLR